MWGRLGPRAGIPKRLRPKLPTNVLLSNQRGLQHTKRSVDPKTPLCKGKGPENPGVVAPFAVAGCRGGPIRYDVAASYYLIWYDTGGRSHTSAFSSHYWDRLLGYSFLHLPHRFLRVFFSALSLSDVAASLVPSVAAAVEFLYSLSNRCLF